MKAWLIERLNELRGRMTLPPHDLLRHEHLILTQEALQQLEERLAA